MSFDNWGNKTNKKLNLLKKNRMGNKHTKVSNEFIQLKVVGSKKTNVSSESIFINALEKPKELEIDSSSLPSTPCKLSPCSSLSKTRTGSHSVLESPSLHIRSHSISLGNKDKRLSFSSPAKLEKKKRMGSVDCSSANSSSVQQTPDFELRPPSEPFFVSNQKENVKTRRPNSTIDPYMKFCPHRLNENKYSRDYSRSPLISYNDKTAIIKKWIGFDSNTIIFDSSQEELSPRSLKSVIKGKTNLMMIIVSEGGEQFGFFVGGSFTPKTNDVNTFECEESLVFILKNHLHSPILIPRISHTESTTIQFSLNNDSLLVFDDTITLTQTSCFINSNTATSRYQLPIENILCGEEITTSRLLIVEWY